MKAPTDLLPLIKWLRKRDPQSRQYAAATLAKLGAEAEAAIPDLAILVKDADVEVARTAARALGHIGPLGVPALIEALDHPSRSVRREAVWALKGLGPAAQEAVPALIRVLDDPDTRVRLSATHALGLIGAAAESAIPDLILLLRSTTNLILCRLAAEALARIGQAALPALTDLLQSHDDHVRREAAWARRMIVPDLPDSDTAVIPTANANGDTGLIPVAAPGRSDRTVPIAMDCRQPVAEAEPVRSEAG